MCCHHVTGTGNDKSSFLLNLGRSRRLRIAGSLHRCNAGGVAKEIDHILVRTYWRILQNCRVFQSVKFFVIDHRLIVGTLKHNVKVRKPRRCDHTMLYLEKLKDLTCAQEYAVTVSYQFRVLDTLEDLVELWLPLNVKLSRLLSNPLGSARGHRGVLPW